MQASNLCFSAARLFYFLTLCAAATSLFGWLGVPVGCFVMLIWMQILAGARREQAQETADVELLPRNSDCQTDAMQSLPCRTGVTKLEVLVVLLIAALVIGLLMPAAREYEPQQQAETSMSMVAKAIDAYQQHFAARLPVMLVSDDGRPLHSWRALILPFLGEQKLADAYRWDEPWNGPNNSELAQYRPWHYRTYYPTAETQRTTTALHLLSDCDGEVVVVEHEQAVCDWLAPTQLDDVQLFNRVAAEDEGFWRHGFFSSLYCGRLAVSHARTMRLHPRDDERTALDKPLVGETVGDQRSQRKSLDIGSPYRRLHWDNALRLGFFLLIVLYPLRWLARKK